MREVGFGGCTPGAVELWAQPDDFAREQLSTAGPVASIFAQFLSEVFGSAAQVRWVDRPPRVDRAPSLAMVEAERDRAARAAARERALRDDALKRVLEAFEGELVEAEPDPGAPAASEAEVG